MKKLIKLIIILVLLTQSAGQGYALRPMAEKVSTKPPIPIGADEVSLDSATKGDAEFAFSELERAVKLALERYSNVHRGTGQHSMISTKLYDHARQIVLDYLGLDEDRHEVIFDNPRRLKLLISKLKNSKSYNVLWSSEIGLPLGIGALVVEREVLPDVPPSVGGGTVSDVLGPENAVWAEMPEKFEPGTPNIIGVIAFAKALNIIRAVGDKHIFKNRVKDTEEVTARNDLLGELAGEELLSRLRELLIGSSALVPTERGDSPYVNLDNGASTPTFLPIWEAARRVLRLGDVDAEGVISEAKKACARFFSAPEEQYDTIFTSNTTDGINIIAKSLKRPAADGATSVVYGTLLEHNSNLLPWMQMTPQQGDSLLSMPVDAEGFFDASTLQNLEDTLREYNRRKAQGNKRIRIIAISGASNVLGTFNNIKEVSEIAHKYGAHLLVDAAQLAPHKKIDMQELGIDYLVFSGHKMYAPFGSGGLIVRKNILNFRQRELKEIKELGKENLVGIAAMSKAMQLLERIGMDVIAQEERKLTEQTLRELLEFNEAGQQPVIEIFGVTDIEKIDERGATIALHVEDIPHNVVARMLAEKGGIGVRSGCFCAHLLVRHLICPRRRETGMCVKHENAPGLVRVSFGIENTNVDVRHFIDTLRAILADPNSKPDPERRAVCPYLAIDELGPVTEITQAIESFVTGLVAEVYDMPGSGLGPNFKLRAAVKASSADADDAAVLPERMPISTGRAEAGGQSHFVPAVLSAIASAA